MHDARYGDPGSRNVGFGTIGNATIICHHRVPILATDPWLGGIAYFGSWGLSHQIPEEQRQAIQAAQYIWFSHGHPDYLSADALPNFKDKTLLLPDHVGGRVKNDLESGGYKVQVLKDCTWIKLSDKCSLL